MTQVQEQSLAGARIAPQVAGAKRVLTWEPNPGPQSDLFGCPAEIICYGGAAYGGKTDAAIVWCAQGYNKPGYRALILRKTFPELERHIINRAREIFPEPIATYNQRTHNLTFRCPDGGTALIEFGYIDQDFDTDQYQGSQYTRIAIDESTYHSEKQVRNMLRYLRAPVEGMRCQMLLTTNPIGPGYGWHWKLFWEKRKPFAIYEDGRWESDKRLIWEGPESRENPKLRTCFIPAKYTDNKAGMDKDPGYPSRLRAQEGPLAQALLDGRLDVVQGTALDFTYRLHTCEPFTIPSYAHRWMSLDWGKTDQACTTWFFNDDVRTYMYRDFARPGKEIKPYAHEVAEMCKGEEIAFCVLSHECFSDHGMGITQAQQFAEVFNMTRYNIPLVKSDKNGEGRVMLWREFLRTTPLDQNRSEHDYHYWVDKFNRDGSKAMEEYRMMLANSSDNQLPRLMFFRWNEVEGVGKLGCPYVIQTLPLLVVDLKHPRKIAPGQDDHGFDAGGYGLEAFTNLATLPAELIFRYNLGGRIPDSEFARDLAMQHAEEIADELAGANGLNPVKWQMERFRG